MKNINFIKDNNKLSFKNLNLVNCILTVLTSTILALSVNSQIITTLAGNGIAGFSGDDSLAINAKINYPTGVYLGTNSNIYFADFSNHRIRKVDATGIITTVAGTGTSGFSGNGIPANTSKLNYPYDVCLDASGNIYISDQNNHMIRKIDAITGLISTVAGVGGLGFSGDGGLATAAQLFMPQGICVDAVGNIYIADWGNNRIRKVTASTGIITTVAGNGMSGYSGDGNLATTAKIQAPQGLAIDASGNLYIADVNNNRIRKVDAITGIISTVAGNGTSGFSGDGALATTAKLSSPRGVSLDNAGNIYIADANNNVIRKVTASTGFISTVAGTYGFPSFSGDGGLATDAQMFTPFGVHSDALGNFYIADSGNNRIRKVPNPTANLNDISTQKSEISLYPNPANMKLNIKGLDGTTKITLLDITYKIVFETSTYIDINTFSLDVTPFSQGIYTLVIENEGKLITEKISVLNQ